MRLVCRGELVALGVEAAEVPVVDLVRREEVALEVPPVCGGGEEGAGEHGQRGEPAVDGLAAEVLLVQDPAGVRGEVAGEVAGGISTRMVPIAQVRVVDKEENNESGENAYVRPLNRILVGVLVGPAGCFRVATGSHASHVKKTEVMQ